MPVGVRPHPGRDAPAQSSSVGPLGMYGLCLQSLAPFGDDLLRIWACFPPSLGPDLLGSGPSPPWALLLCTRWCYAFSLRILNVFSLIIKHLSCKTYKHQNLLNSLVVNHILSSVFRINGFYVGFWKLNLCNKHHQQASPHLLFARPRAKLCVTMDHDFKRYDASIKVIHVIPYTCGFLKCLPCCLEWLKSGTAVTSSHHFPSMKHNWSFCIFEIESIAHTSPQMVLSNRSMVFISLPRH